jgi:hypothetical protein
VGLGVDEILVLLPYAVSVMLRMWQERLHSSLDYAAELEVECSNDDPNDAAFVQATSTIRGRDAVEEYLACKMYPLDAGFGFGEVPVGVTPVLKVETHLPLFTVSTIAAEHASHVLAEVKTEAERVSGSFGPREYGALVLANVMNGGVTPRIMILLITS